MTTKEYLSNVEKKVLANAAEGSEAAVVPIPDYFTIEELKEVMRRIHYFKFFRDLSNKKARSISKVVHVEFISVLYNLQYDLNMVIRWN